MEKNKNLISVIVPVYNVYDYLDKCIQSIQRQSYSNIEIILVDDGSTDGTEALVRQWQLNDNGFEIQYMYKKNGGMHTAHNVAYENITTELNVCIDSDDILSDGAVEKILKK